ncbi:MAG: exopolysaccharide biosynthesis protein [Proteobacteria bacterium SG_bin6]|nr:MAG: exopolysaccharide biosynthesis protein [Proteobacteria bacterium SG_bin6]
MSRGSLLERAATVYDFGEAFRAREAMPPVAAPAVAPAPATEPAPVRFVPPVEAPVRVPIDRAVIEAAGLIVPGGAVTPLAEEMRLVKRQLLLNARALAGKVGDRSRLVLVTSPHQDEGKTFCAMNLALSLAAEREGAVLLIDADVAKPDVLGRLGLKEGPGLLDALADPRLAIEGLIVPTDLGTLSVLGAGARSNADTELLASARLGELLDALLAADPQRLIILDSPPALAASAAAALALQVGQVVLVARADRTGETDLREAVALLDGCPSISLLLNAVTFTAGPRRFGYYGMEDA